MEKKKSNKISWSTIYSLGLVPAILVWGLAPSLKENVIVLTSIIAGIIWTIFSRLYIHFFKGCGIIGWITGWSMIFGGITKAFLLLFGYYNIPIVLFWAPCIISVRTSEYTPPILLSVYLETRRDSRTAFTGRFQPL